MKQALQNRRTSFGWRLGVVAAVAVMLLALYPQLNFWRVRGQNWAGSYAYLDTDEEAYAAYLNALIDGRPRRNDPYTGRDDRADSPQPESLFSIQFLPAYATALTARALRLNAQQMFILLTCLAALAASLALFYLLASATGDDRVAAVGVLCVLCLGTLASAHSAGLGLFGLKSGYAYFPFLRRYIPAAAFPFYFVFCELVRRSVTVENKRRAWRVWLLETAAGLCFAVLVYSYFYLWTAAAAWLALVMLLWFVARPRGWRRDIKSLSIIASLAAIALVPYLILLSHRAATTDTVQVLTHSRAPDLFRAPEFIGAFVICLLAWGARRGLLNRRDKRVLYAASHALLPFVVFNQQIVTGRSLQPIHYEQFIANYVAMIALALACALVWPARATSEESQGARRRRSRALILAATLALCWGIIETTVAARIFLRLNLFRDQAMPVALRVAELERARQDGNSMREKHLAPPVVLCQHPIQADAFPGVAPQAVLWAPHTHVFAGVTLEEDRERFYQRLYYTDVDAQDLADELARKDFYHLVALFGWDRANFGLTVNPAPITDEEINNEIQNYADYIASFNRARASRLPLSYIITLADEEPSFANLDRWYTRDEGERFGLFTLYRVRLRQ